MSLTLSRQTPAADAGCTDGLLIEAGAALVAAGLARARSGNLSARVGELIRITAAGARLGRLTVKDLAWLRLDGEPFDTTGSPPSSEAALHAAIYRRRPDVGAIVHAHSPFATTWASLEGDLPLKLTEATYYGMGAVAPVVPQAPAGTATLVDLVVARIGNASALLLERHGTVALASGVMEAVDIAESLEHQAHVAWAERMTPRVSDARGSQRRG